MMFTSPSADLSVLLESLILLLSETWDSSELQALWCTVSVPMSWVGEKKTVPCPQLDGTGDIAALQAAVGFVICVLSTLWLRFIFVRPRGHLHSQRSGQ